MSTRILIGPFRRRVFADGLRALLDQEPGLVVSELSQDQDIYRHLNAEAPTILILEHGDDSAPFPMPVSPAVGVILVSQDGADVQIALRQLGAERLRAAIGLVEESEHPKVVSITADQEGQPLSVMPRYQHQGESALKPLVDWLDAAFAIEIERLEQERGETGTGWAFETAQIRSQLSGGAPITQEIEAERFQKLLDTPLWQQRLIRSLGLDVLEVRAICLAAAPDIDQKYAAAIGLLQNDYNTPRPNVSTLGRMLKEGLVGGDFQAILGSRRYFSRFEIVRLAKTEKPGVPQPGLCVAPPILELILGLAPTRGAGWIVQDRALPAQPDLVESLEPLFENTLGNSVAIVSPGYSDSTEELTAGLLATGRVAHRFDASSLTDKDHVATALRDQALRARLHPSILVVEGLENAPSDIRNSILDVDLGDLAQGVVYCGANTAPRFADLVTGLKISGPDSNVRSARWLAAMRNWGLEESETAASSMAARIRFSLKDVEAVARLALGMVEVGTKATIETVLLDAARLVSAQHAPPAVRRPPCSYTWDDIVLPAKIAKQVKSIPNHVLNGPTVLDSWGYAARLSYGRGVGVLFSGSSGTGKTMCAQVIAGSLGVELMQVELSRCISKYIGETEKNIDACFKAAEAASAALLFDEADALFGKRTEIKDAHDRHANVEVAYLLQRIEAFEGLVILTSNLKANIDPAFLRRLRFVVDFPMPDAEDRAAIWARAIPPAAPRGPDVDVSFLARRLQLSGGSIQQIAVNAAFAAASDSGTIEMRHIVDATRAELLKLGMLTAERSLPDLVEQKCIEGSVS